MKHPMHLSAIALAVAFSAGSASAQSYGSGGSSSSGTGSSVTGGQSAPAAQPGAGTRKSETSKDDKVASADRKFMEKAAESGMFEVQISQLAATRAKDPQVKEFANMLVTEHTKANDELTKMANAKGVELPAAPPRAKRNEIEKLGKKQGDEFDKDFVKNVGVDDHKKDIKEFEKASKDAKDPELKAWAAKTLPNLQNHLAMAQKLPQAGGKGDDAAKMGAGAGGTQSPGDTPGGASTKSGGGSGANKTGS